MSIRIRLESQDNRVLDCAAKDIMLKMKESGAQVAGPIPLPIRVENYKILSANKKPEGVIIRTHKRIIDLKTFTAKTVEAMKKLNVPIGISVKIKA